MRFVPYNASHEEGALSLLDCYMDFAPESAFGDNTKHLDEEMIKDPSGSLVFVGISEDDARVVAYMSVGKNRSGSLSPWWYISALFTEDTPEAENIAASMVSAFEETITETMDICANVHPSSPRAIAFWESQGYPLNADRSIYFNTEDECLMAYWKRLPKP